MNLSACAQFHPVGAAWGQPTRVVEKIAWAHRALRLALHRSRGGNPVNKLYEPDEQYMQNRPVKTLAYYLDGILDKNVLQRVTIPYNLDISLPDIPAGNISALKTALLSLGIRLTPSTEITEQFIIYQSPKQ